MSRLTHEEQLLHDLAIEYHAKHGHTFTPMYIAPYNIAGGEQGCMYMVNGRIERGTCHSCRECYTPLGMVLFIRIGHGFTQLMCGDIKPVNPEDDGLSLFARLLGLEDE